MKTMIDPLRVSFPVWEVLEDDSLLVQSAQLGDLDAFNTIVLTHEDALYNMAYRVLDQEDAAEDALQEALISAFRYIQDFHGGSLKAWLMRIVINKCYDLVRPRRTFTTISLSQDSEDGSENEDELIYKKLLHHPATVEELVEARQLNESIEQCISNLSVDFRTIVTLVDIEEMPYTEVAMVLNIPVGTVKSRLARARANLRRKLKACKRI